MKTQPKNIVYKLVNIELIAAGLSSPDEYLPSGTYTFDITLESRLNIEVKDISILVSIKVKDEVTEQLLGNLTARYWYQIEDFDLLIIKKDDEKVVMPEELQKTLNRISISSSRGLLFSAFKGTLLHSAVLPILDIE